MVGMSGKEVGVNMDDLVTNLVVGLVMLLFGGFIADFPHRFLHPFKGKAVHHSKGPMMFMRVCGGIVCLGGIRFVAASVWVIMKHTSQQ